jgi:hypothetical protein
VEVADTFFFLASDAVITENLGQLAPKRLVLKKGALIMRTVNASRAFFNKKLGHVGHIGKDHVQVTYLDGSSERVSAHTFILRNLDGFLQQCSQCALTVFSFFLAVVT